MAAFNFVVSSYTSSISALITPQNPDVLTLETEPNALVVAQPATPGFGLLPGVTKEVNSIQEYLPGRPVILNAEEATVSAVSRAMKDHTWVHFACHGIQDSVDSTNSAFALYDGKLRISDLMKIYSKGAELAVLSACQMATGDDNHSEESMTCWRHDCCRVQKCHRYPVVDWG